MELIAISGNTLINPEKIDSVEVEELRNGGEIRIVVNGTPHVVENQFFMKVLEQLKTIGLDSSAQTFAG